MCDRRVGTSRVAFGCATAASSRDLRSAWTRAHTVHHHFMATLAHLLRATQRADAVGAPTCDLTDRCRASQALDGEVARQGVRWRRAVRPATSALKRRDECPSYYGISLRQSQGMPADWLGSPARPLDHIIIYRHGLPESQSGIASAVLTMTADYSA